jgi:DNA recombination protein RmuC
MQSLQYAIIGLGIGAILLVALVITAHRFSRRSTAAESELTAVRSERERLAAELLRERTTAADCAQRAARSEALLEASAAEQAKSGITISELNAQLHLQRAEIQTLKEQHAEARANLVHTERANQELRAFLTEAQTRLSGLFAELAGDAFAKKAEVFEKNVKAAGEQSKSDLGLLLQPFAERMAEFGQRIETLYGTEARDRATLQGAVNELKTLNQDMAEKTAALTRALKGNAKIRGDWGELMLETVLNACGLEEGRHYDRQKTSTLDDGEKLRPDIVVRLPDERKIVVDSKVSLLAWIDAMNSETPEGRNDALRRHSVALRQHVKDLGEKNYPNAVGPTALEITVAFVPIEGALSAALDFDPSLQMYAFDRRVVFSSPNTLMALLGVVERLWTRDKIQRRAMEMSELGGKVVDALVKFLEDFDRIGVRIAGAQDAFGEARRSLSESNQALLPRARRLVDLGARGKRLLPEELQPDLIEQADNSLEVVGADKAPIIR